MLFYVPYVGIIQIRLMGQGKTAYSQPAFSEHPVFDYRYIILRL